MGTDNCFTAYPVEYNAVMTTSDIFTDLCIICMGWVVITQSLSFSRNNRGIISGATFVTVLGLFTIACSCVRAAVSVGMSKAVQKGVLVSGKESYDLAEWLVVVGLAEFNTALIAASLPTLRVIWRKYRDGRKRGTKRSEEGSFGSGSSRLGDEEMGPKESDGTAMPTSLVFMTEPEKNLRSVDSTMSMEFERMVAVVEKKAWSNVLERDDSRRATPGTEMEVQMREHGLMGQVKPPRIHR